VKGILTQKKRLVKAAQKEVAKYLFDRLFDLLHRYFEIDDLVSGCKGRVVWRLAASSSSSIFRSFTGVIG